MHPPPFPLSWPLRRYFDFVNFNVSGFRPYVTTLWAVLLGSLRKSAARILVLVVSMGYGVVRPTLGGISTQVGCTTCCGAVVEDDGEEEDVKRITTPSAPESASLC